MKVRRRVPAEGQPFPIVRVFLKGDMLRKANRKVYKANTKQRCPMLNIGRQFGHY
jgi:hypothetical protein